MCFCLKAEQQQNQQKLETIQKQADQEQRIKELEIKVKKEANELDNRTKILLEQMEQSNDILKENLDLERAEKDNMKESIKKVDESIADEKKKREQAQTK